MTTKITAYLDSDMYRIFQLRATEMGRSVSSLLNEAMCTQLNDDLQDINSIRSRLAKKEQSLSYETALKALKRSKLLDS